MLFILFYLNIRLMEHLTNLNSFQVVRMVMRHHEELRQKEERAKREEQAKLRRVASSIAKEVRAFWSSVEKVTSSAFFWLKSLLHQKLSMIHTLNSFPPIAVHRWSSINNSPDWKRSGRRL